MKDQNSKISEIAGWSKQRSLENPMDIDEPFPRILEQQLLKEDWRE